MDEKIIEEVKVETEAEKAIEPDQNEKLKSLSNDELVDYALKLRKENADKRSKSKELEDQINAGKNAIDALKKIEDEKLLAEGNYKELLKAKDEELSEYKTNKETLEKYEAIFQTDLEIELKGLSESTVKMIENSGMSIADKLTNARAIRKELGLKSSSPASQKVGGDGADNLGVETVLEKYHAEKDSMKKIKLLNEMRIKMPDAYAKIK